MTPAAVAAPSPLSDEHSVLLWQTCAYADELGETAASGGRLTPAYDALLEFLHYRLLPYLAREERELPRGPVQDPGLLRILAGEHDRLRTDVDGLESSRTLRQLTAAASSLVVRLDRHVRREERWLADLTGDRAQAEVQDWPFPLLFGDVIDVDALPVDRRDALVRQRLVWMAADDVVLLESAHDLHPLWRWQHAVDRNSHVWAYELDGPLRWRVRITRRVSDD